MVVYAHLVKVRGGSSGGWSGGGGGGGVSRGQDNPQAFFRGPPKWLIPLNYKIQEFIQSNDSVFFPVRDMVVIEY